MNIRDAAWRMLELAAVLLTAAAPAYVAYDVWTRGTSPEKLVELKSFQGTNPLQDLSALGEKAALSLTVEGQTITNLVISQAFLSNAGKAPIVPADYIEPLSVNVEKPWKIVAVANKTNLGGNVELKWKRIDDLKFEAEPTLLNPGDSVFTYVYLTNTQPAAADPATPTKEASVKWKARIVNLRSFLEPPSIFDQTSSRWGIVVELGGWGVPFTLTAFVVFLAAYLHLLLRVGVLGNWNTQAIAITTASGLLSLIAAECIATYLFGSIYTAVSGINHWLNAAPIALHVAALGLLIYKSKKQPTLGISASEK